MKQNEWKCIYGMGICMYVYIQVHLFLFLYKHAYIDVLKLIPSWNSPLHSECAFAWTFYARY